MLKVSLQNVLGEALRQVRKSRQLTQQAVANIGGVSVPTIRLLERGRGNLCTWAAVLDVLGVELVGRNRSLFRGANPWPRLRYNALWLEGVLILGEVVP